MHTVVVYCYLTVNIIGSVNTVSFPDLARRFFFL